jgi:hypothetical protein
MTEEQELAWLAGLLEGEGTFMVVNCHTKNLAGRVYRYPCITVNMTDRDVIERVALLFGGQKVHSIKPRPQRLPAFRAVVTGEPAAILMRCLLPFMGLRRRRKIKECLVEWGSRPEANKARSLSMKKAVKKRKRSSSGTFVSAAPAVMADFAR